MSLAQADMARRPGPDAQAMMAFESRKKSIGVAYLIWLFFAGFGAHRLYAGRTASGLAMLLLSVAGWIMLLFFLNLFVLAAFGIWVIVDAFLIPRMISDYNTRLANELG